MSEDPDRFLPPMTGSERVRFLLVEPRSGGNVGSVARALKNLGFERLGVVSPACDPLGDEARRMAKDAVDLLESAVVSPDLEAALDGAGIVVGTSRRVGKHRSPHWSLPSLAPELLRLARTADVAFVFGREDHGLSDATLDRCTHLVRIPASKNYPSYNLAQSVMLVAYELRRTGLVVAAPEEALEAPAEQASREAMYDHLETALRAIGFLHEDSAEPMMRRIRRMLGRAVLSETEVRMLRGVARQALWLARRAGLPTGRGARGRR